MKKKGHTRNPRSNRQTTYRIMFAWLATEWAQIGPANRLLWEPDAKLAKISPYNAYIAANTQLWLNYQAPSQTPETPGIGTPSTRNISTANWDGEKFNIRAGSATVNDGWGYIIHAGTFGGFTPDRSTAIIISNEDIPGQLWWTWKPANPISTRFRFTVYTKDGLLTQQIAGWNVTVP
jgi:hypothetical protein